MKLCIFMSKLRSDTFYMMTTMMRVGCTQDFYPFALTELEQLRDYKIMVVPVSSN